LIKESKNEWRIEFCNNVLDECVTTLKKDRADKSASIFFIENDELSMFSYYRIDFDSSRGRKFKKGDGFAGDIWESMQFKTIEDVSQHESFANDLSPHHHYQSIIGCPIQIGTEVYGVLCIQSEQKNGFDKEDEIPIKFYADICALAYFCDKILIRGDVK
jgi:putative methionine-R-sulfoxide reductase with GAF domain